MHIQRKERVVFQENPLVEVIAQVRFPKILNLNDERLTKFQDKMKESYPKVEESDSKEAYIFKSLDENTYVYLSSESLTLTTSDYSQWSVFFEKIKAVFSIGKDIYDFTNSSRIGLCYRDFISRNSLGLEDVSWRELISSDLLGIWGGKMFSDSASGYIPDDSLDAMFTSYSIKIEDYMLNLKAGLANKSQVSDKTIIEEGFLIETDFYSDDWKELTSERVIIDYFEKLHFYSSTIFQKCITQKLYDALKPIPQPQ